MNEQINHPNHYNSGSIEAIDVIEDWKLNFSLGCVVKYICRAEYKGSTIQDLEKAAWYLNREINRRKQHKSEQKLDKSES
jgi:hypothetical protein